MIRHVLKLVWNRKRSSFLLILEMAISFIVLFFRYLGLVKNVRDAL